MMENQKKQKNDDVLYFWVAGRSEFTEKNEEAEPFPYDRRESSCRFQTKKVGKK